MKTIRLKIILILGVISLILIGYIFVEHTHLVDFAATKNSHYRNKILLDITESNDIQFVKDRSNEMIDGLVITLDKHSEHGSKIFTAILLLICNGLIIVVLTIVELKSKNVL